MPETFAALLTRLRQERGFTQHSLAAAAGVSRSTLARLEAGTFAPTWATVQALARGLAVSTEDLRTDFQENRTVNKPTIRQRINDLADVAREYHRTGNVTLRDQTEEAIRRIAPRAYAEKVIANLYK